MKYKEVRLDFEYCEKGRFYRTLLVLPGTNLVDLGCAIITAFGGMFEHSFLFNSPKGTFFPRAFMEEGTLSNAKLMNNYIIEALGDEFTFTYDPSEGYDFTATVTESETEYDGENNMYLIDGAGQGIWEDNIYTLQAYLDGEIEDPYTKEDEEQGYSLPWNFPVETYSEFDTSFDLELEMDRFESMYLADIDEYKDSENEFFGSYDENELTNVEDEEYDDAEEEFMDMVGNLFRTCEAMVEEQIKEEPEIKEIYEKLLVNHKSHEAKEMILKEFIYFTMQKASKGEYLEPKEYINDLKKLVK